MTNLTAKKIEDRIVAEYPRHLTGTHRPEVTAKADGSYVVRCGVRATVAIVREVMIDLFGVENCEWNGCEQTVRIPATCEYCGRTYEGRSHNHDCRTLGLPKATRRDGKYAMRRHEGDGYVMWVDIPDTKANREFDLGGTSYIVGHVSDPANFEAAVDAAEEEARVLMAEAAAEFGF